MRAGDSRPDPEELLSRIRKEERRDRRGRLRIYLGAFPGVGKTYAMLNEAQRRRMYGEDVVVGYVETHGRKSTAIQLEGLEVIPRKQIPYRGRTLEEMDVEAILRRKPAVCLVDELAHTNAPGSEREKRFEDVEVLLKAGIDVVSTLNVQHLESLNDQVEQITGVRVGETIPDYVLDEADEVILVDLSPEGARARMEHGHIYPPEQARQALEHFFRPENLGALRELALRRTAKEVDEKLDELMRADQRTPVREDKVLVLVDETPGSRTLIRSGWRLAQGLDAELLAAYEPKELSAEARRSLARNLELAEDLNARLVALEGTGLRKALARLLSNEGIKHVVLPHRARNPLQRLTHASLQHDLLNEVPDLHAHLVRVE